MSRTSKLTMVTLVVALSIGGVLLWGETCYAQATGGIAHDYQDTYGVRHRVVSDPYLDVEVWVDKGDGSTYHPGEEIKVYFQASRDCFIVLYNIDTRGYVHLLYPLDGGDDTYIEGERVYRIPDRFDDYDLTVDGPNGVEYTQAVASLEPLDLPNFPGEYTYDGEVYAYNLDGEDPFEFMAEVNAEIAPYDYAADVCMFSVEYPHPEWYYWPRTVYVDRPVDVYWGGAYFDYPWGVEVWIDGMFYGITPITIPWLVVGRHYASFWYRGCWIWRDWFHTRRHHTVTVWADCYDRYRYVDERFVEKNYREEKARRRRGIGKTDRLIRPAKLLEKRRLAKAEPSRIRKGSEFKKEVTEKRRGLKDRATFSSLSKKAKPRKIDRAIRAEDTKKPSPAQRARSVQKTKAKKIKSEGRKARKIKAEHKVNRPKQPQKATQKIRKGERSKPGITKARIKSGDKRVTKSTGGKKAPSKGTTKGSTPSKRRR